MTTNIKPVFKEILVWIIWIAAAFLIAFLIHTFFFTLVQVQGQSMEPTLYDGDRLVVSKFMYKPKDGDIISFKPKNDTEYYIKRVIATEGETINIDYGKSAVYVNGKLLNEPYIKEQTLVKTYLLDMQFPTVVPKDCIFVMGDNRNGSVDSRDLQIGFVQRKDILGKALYIYSPLNHHGKI